MTLTTFYFILTIWSGMALVTFFGLLLMPAPYGRHGQQPWGPSLDGTVGWILMEFPAVITYAWIFFISSRTGNFFNITFLLLWQLHYLHRCFVFPLRRRETLSPMPLYLVLVGMLFNIVNALLNSYWINFLSNGYSNAWLVDISFIVGIMLFLAGFFININADEKLLVLKKQGDSRYTIPHGGLYDYISCPNYFGEILEWIGFSIATWSPAAFTFALWTCANLIPRALSHHHWYQHKFQDYPKSRKAIIPFLF